MDALPEILFVFYGGILCGVMLLSVAAFWAIELMISGYKLLTFQASSFVAKNLTTEGKP
jgi:hypothetical protein